MTFILSVATPNAVYQVCDRRLTWIDGPEAGGIKDDDANKALIVDGRMAFAYTGIATVRGVQSDIWLANCLKGVPTGDLAHVCRVIREQATRDFAKMAAHTSLHLQHAIVGIGWATYAGEPLAPMLVTISNALDGRGEWIERPRAEFTLSLDEWGVTQKGYAVASAGQPLNGREQATIWRELRQAFRKRNASHLLLIQKMALLVRWVASRHPTVGMGLLAVCIPQKAVLRSLKTGESFILTGGMPTDDTATFFHVPVNGEQLQRYGPHTAMNGSITTGFTLTYLQPGWS